VNIDIFVLLQTFYLWFLYDNTMVTDYRGFCTRCKRTNPEYYLEVRKDDNEHQREYWCIDCIRGNK
jgi:hypothetical protein